MKTVKCLQTLPKFPWGQNLPWLRTPVSEGSLLHFLSSNSVSDHIYSAEFMCCWVPLFLKSWLSGPCRILFTNQGANTYRAPAMAFALDDIIQGGHVCNLLWHILVTLKAEDIQTPQACAVLSDWKCKTHPWVQNLFLVNVSIYVKCYKCIQIKWYVGKSLMNHPFEKNELRGIRKCIGKLQDVWHLPGEGVMNFSRNRQMTRCTLKQW